jgi:hypothetical protein
MNPPLFRSALCEFEGNIYLAGGLDNNKTSAAVYKFPKNDPSKMAKAFDLKVPRVGAFAFVIGENFVVIGGSEPGLIEAFNVKTWKPVSGLEAKSKSFFNQLACYTGDIKMEGATLS